MTCPRDGSAMREDTEFLVDALREGVDVQRWVCIYGHSAYPHTTPEQRGWTPREKGTACRACSRCGESLPLGDRSYLCDHCVKAPPRPCSACGKPTPRNRKTCSAACLSAVSAVTGRRALEEQHRKKVEKKVESPRQARTADEILKDHWKRSA